jgi:subfamily B ATP-binding cassette protein MsbA
LQSSSPLNRIARYYAKPTAFVVAGGVFSTLLEGAGIGLTIPLLALLPSSDARASWFVDIADLLTQSAPDGYQHVAIAALILLCVVLKGTVSVAVASAMATIEVRAGHRVRLEMAEALARADYRFLVHETDAGLFSAIGTDAWRVADGVRSALSLMTAAAATLVLAAIMFFLSWSLFLVAFVGSVTLALVQSRARQRARSASYDLQKENVRLSDRMMMITKNSGRLIRIFGTEQEELKGFDRSSRFVAGLLSRIYVIKSINFAGMEALYAVVFLMILLAAPRFGVPLPELVVFLVMMYRLQPHILTVASSVIELESVRGAVVEVDRVLAVPVSTGGDGLAYMGEFGSIEFDDVSVRYDENANFAVNSLTFSISAGKWTALSGSSGAGKSTIVNILTRLIEPTEGTVLVDGIDLSAIDKAAWRRNLSVAGQDVEVFEGTIWENVTYGRRSTLEEFASATKAACVDEFVASLPKGHETEIGERGVAVSGGQRQRLCLARALIRQPSLLILDEATSGLDYDLEWEVLRRIRLFLPVSSVILISHKQDLLSFCDDRIDI